MFAFPLRFHSWMCILVPAIILYACSSDDEVRIEVESEVSTQKAFFENMRSLCGQEFYGETTYPDDPEHELAGAELYMHVALCDENEIRIPFHVDENTSRTWVLTYDDQGMLLKHDHRHSDGTPEDLSNYGGFANHEGDAFRQYFPADEETADMLPAASTNVWMMEMDLDEMIFIYYLERHDQPRYRAEFSLSNNIE